MVLVPANGHLWGLSKNGLSNQTKVQDGLNQSHNGIKSDHQGKRLSGRLS